MRFFWNVEVIWVKGRRDIILEAPDKAQAEIAARKKVRESGVNYPLRIGMVLPWTRPADA